MPSKAGGLKLLSRNGCAAAFNIRIIRSGCSWKEWISLSDEFFEGNTDFLDVKVKVIYDGEKGDIINQYVTFSKVYTEQLKLHGRSRTAVLETIRICKDKDVLKEYLENREKEVISIMMALFEQEYAVERYGDEKKAEGILETLFSLVKDGILSITDLFSIAFNVRGMEAIFLFTC